MKKIFLMTVTIISLAAVSCKKDKDNMPAPGNNSKLLTKMTKTEGSVTTVYNFVYDGNKRLTSFKSTDNKTGVIFTYDGNNLVKVEDNEDDFKNIYTYTYTNGKPVSGTFKSWQKTAGEPDDLIEDDVLSYTITNEKVSTIHVQFLLAGNDATDFGLQYGNDGNLAKVSTNSGYTASFIYGNKKPVFPIVSNYILDQAGFSLQFAAKNEMKEINFDFPGDQFDEHVINQYTYDSNGYVLTSTDGTNHIVYEYQ
ncbi:MAG: hypothetical protein QM726_07890 [Chitinophagaceae bacterium]